MDTLIAVAQSVRLGSGVLVASVGLVFMLGGAIGQLRFPDFYTRLHAANVANAVGAPLVIVGLALCAGDWSGFLRLMLLALLLGAAGPTLSQLAANAAHSAGLAPLSGKYVAPRPGAPRVTGRQ